PSPPTRDRRTPSRRGTGARSPGSRGTGSFSGGIDLDHAVDVYDVDYETPASVVAELHARGRKVIAYVPVGNWESYRPDSDEFPAEALCGSIEGWPERYVDVRHPEVAKITQRRIELAASKGFDGIEGD